MFGEEKKKKQIKGIHTFKQKLKGRETKRRGRDRQNKKRGIDLHKEEDEARHTEEERHTE